VKAFPHLPASYATDEELKLQKEKFMLYIKDKGKVWSLLQQVKPHNDVFIYTKSLANYGDCQEIRPHLLRVMRQNEAQEKCAEYFYFTDSIMDQRNLKILRKIRKEGCSIGVHVRRGDDAENNIASNVNYFIKAIQKAEELYTNCYFFFFSDEPGYVKDTIFPKLIHTRKEIVDINDVDHCYRDLFLMSECKHQIASQGSMGKIAYLINKNPGKKLIAPPYTRTYKNIKPDFLIEE
jgi:hypothetical protein